MKSNDMKFLVRKMKMTEKVCGFCDAMKEHADIAYFMVVMITFLVMYLSLIITQNPFLMIRLLIAVVVYSIIWVVMCFVVSPIANKFARKFSGLYIDAYLEEKKIEKARKRQALSLM